MADLLGLFKHDNYNWRSMTTPSMSGLFNPNCLKSAAENLIKCYAGDNTFSGPPNTDESLVHPDNQFYALTTTVAKNGADSVVCCSDRCNLGDISVAQAAWCTHAIVYLSRFRVVIASINSIDKQASG